MARRVLPLLDEPFPDEPQHPHRGVRWDPLLNMPNLREYYGPDWSRALSAIRDYCRQVSGGEPEAIHCFKERGPRSYSIYRVEARTRAGNLWVFWISANGQMVQFPPEKRR